MVYNIVLTLNYVVLTTTVLLFGMKYFNFCVIMSAHGFTVMRNRITDRE